MDFYNIDEKWLAFVSPIIITIIGYFVSRKAKATEEENNEADALKKLAEIGNIFDSSDSVEVKNLSEVITAWKILYEATKLELKDIRYEQDKLRLEYNILLVELRRYKHGVDILIKQIRRVGLEPEWTPLEPKETK